MPIECVEQWARWRIYRVGNDLGWPKRDSIGKAMSGVPSTRCPICKGEGRAPGHRVGSEARWVDPCPQCNGKGGIKMDPDPKKANPAYIHSTRSRDSYDDDPTSQKIDYIVCTELTESERSILFMEYTRAGNQNHKISRLKITHSAYNQTLIDAENKILDHLTL